jgi:hypothetical protein
MSPLASIITYIIYYLKLLEHMKKNEFDLVFSAATVYCLTFTECVPLITNTKVSMSFTTQKRTF